MIDKRTHFAPLPLQTIGNRNLSQVDIWVATAVAWHDRFGNNGKGCYAGRSTLAREIGIHETQVSRSLTNLERENIIERSRDPKDRRRRVYRMIYLENPRISGSAVTHSPMTAVGSQKSDKPVIDPAELGDNQLSQSIDLIGENRPNISSPGIDPVETVCSPEEDSLQVEQGVHPFLDALPNPANLAARRHVSDFRAWYCDCPSDVQHALDKYVSRYGPRSIHRPLAEEFQQTGKGFDLMKRAAMAEASLAKPVRSTCAVTQASNDQQQVGASSRKFQSAAPRSSHSAGSVAEALVAADARLPTADKNGQLLLFQVPQVTGREK